MAAAQKIIIAGAGIGGLTAALALARAGFAVSVLEAAPQLEEVGAGVQLSPNASGVLLSLGLGPALRPHTVGLEALHIMHARTGGELVEGPLGVPAAVRYGAPFWAIHRADLQNVLAEAVKGHGVDLHLGVRAEDFALKDGRIVVLGRGRIARVQMEGAALIGADGLWSHVRERLGIRIAPQFCRQTAWRALIPMDAVPVRLREPVATLWLGPLAHVVHYPVRGGAELNVVAIIREDWDRREWSAPGEPDVLRNRVAHFAPALRDLINIPERWTKWALHDHPPLPQWGTGPVTLLGDAAHAMRPFLAQGAGMAIEDAAVLARSLKAGIDDIPAALRVYEGARRDRTGQVQKEAMRTGRRYGWRGPLAAARNFALRRLGGEKLLTRYDWIYEWKDA